ncbi:hypothetical protein DFS34DRAFT_648607 [Phlyctochytrium arcticum]|nr:hypothetical protein DFS34DRAFT_648607 [Phlyctochytrium arcticum]
MAASNSDDDSDSDQGIPSIKVQVVWGPCPEDVTYMYLPLKRGKVHEKLFNSGLPKVLIVWEGSNFTFTAAFVALRRSVANIVTSTFGYLKPDWDGAVRYALKHTEENQKWLRTHRDTAFFSQREVEARYSAVFGTPATGPAYIPLVDARNLERDDHHISVRSHSRNIFFQCPFIGGQDDFIATAKLCSGLMRSSAQVQKKGDSLYIGICANGAYPRSYNVQELITHHAPQNGYRFVGADDQTIKQILHFGYKHESASNDHIHYRIIGDHVTLIFTKRMKGTPSKNRKCTSTT